MADFLRMYPSKGKGSNRSKGFNLTEYKDTSPTSRPPALSGYASEMLAASSGSSDFAGAFNNEGLTSLSLRQHLIN